MCTCCNNCFHYHISEVRQEFSTNKEILPVFIKAFVFHHVGLSWMIETKEQINFAVDKQYVYWCTGGTWFNWEICHNLHGTVFEELFVTAREDRYDIMCGLYAYNQREENSTDAPDFHDGWTLPID